MGSPKGTKKANWSTPLGWLAKDIIHIYYVRGLRLPELAKRYYHHIPRDISISILGRDVPDNSILQRGHKGTFDKNAFEHPDKHVMGKRMMPYAQLIVSQNITIKRIRDLDKLL